MTNKPDALPWRPDVDAIHREREAARQRAWEQACADAKIEPRAVPAPEWLAGQLGRAS